MIPRFHPFLLFLVSLLSISAVHGHSFSHDEVFRVAVIGAGAGGSSVSYFVRNLTGPETDIEIFEKNSYVGGRVTSREIAGDHTELGGAIYHISNRLFSDLVEQGGFTAYNPSFDPPHSETKTLPNFKDRDSLLGVWNGVEFTFISSSQWFVDIISGFWRYGLASFWISQETQEVISKFLNIYSLLDDPSITFSSVEQLLGALNILDLIYISTEDYFAKKQLCGFESKYCEEIVTGLTRVNYGQSMSINALVGMIALTGSTSDIKSVVGGNNQVMDYAIRSSNAIRHMNSVVTKVIKSAVDDHSIRPKYSIEYLDVNNQTSISSDFDFVVIATPIGLSNIEFQGFDLPELNLPEYQVTHVSFVVGNLSLHDYFHRPRGEDEPQLILTTEDPRTEFTSLFLRSRINRHGEHRNLYKIFSRSPLSNSDIDRLFTNRTETYQTKFYAYPVLTPVKNGTKVTPIVLDPGHVFYVNALETAFSTIETEMISGKNIAKLIQTQINSMRTQSQ